MAGSLIVIAGPTGTGKSDLALQLALQLDAEIVNYDSVQIYRGFDIGSAKPPADVRRQVPHHLYDLIDADEEFNAADYAAIARSRCDEIASRGRSAILVGGTFFYLRALLAGLPKMPGRDEALRARIRRISSRPRGPERLHRWLARVDPPSGKKIAAADRQRVERALEVWLTSGRPISTWERPMPNPASELPALKIALSVDRKVLVERLDRRAEEMFRGGLLDETRALLRRYPGSARPFTTIGYKEAASVIAGEMTTDDAIAETRRRTRAYAKRQMTWLRSERNMHWLDASNKQDTLAAALRLIRG